MNDLMKDLMKMAEAANPGVKYCPNCNARMRRTSGVGDYSYSCACGTSYFGRGPASGTDDAPLYEIDPSAMLDRGVAVKSSGGIPGRLYTYEQPDAAREIDPSGLLGIPISARAKYSPCGSTKACGACDKNMVRTDIGDVCECGKFSPGGSVYMFEIGVTEAAGLISMSRRAPGVVSLDNAPCRVHRVKPIKNRNMQ